MNEIIREITQSPQSTERPSANDFPWWSEREVAALGTLNTAYTRVIKHLRAHNQQPRMGHDGQPILLGNLVGSRVDSSLHVHEKHGWDPATDTRGVTIDLKEESMVVFHREASTLLEALGYDPKQVLGQDSIMGHYEKVYLEEGTSSSPWVPVGTIGESNIKLELIPIPALPKVQEELGVDFTCGSMRVVISTPSSQV